MTRKIEITAKVEGYCRCRTIFSKTPKLFDEKFFNPTQLFILKRDGNLTVRITETKPDTDQILEVPPAEKTAVPKKRSRKKVAKKEEK